MNERKPEKLQMESLLALLIFGVFSCCVALVLLAGARVYAGVHTRDQAAAARRTCVQYLTTRVRQAPAGVVVTDLQGVDALLLPEEIDGQRYATWIYCHEGWLYELFGEASGAFSPRDGQRVMELQSLDLWLTDTLLTGRVTGTDGTCVELRLNIEGGVS